MSDIPGDAIPARKRQTPRIALERRFREEHRRTRRDLRQYMDQTGNRGNARADAPTSSATHLTSGSVNQAHHTPSERRDLTWPPESPFADTLTRARNGDHDALTTLYRRFLPVVYRYILARVADTPTAEDITSETFFAMIERIGDTRATDELTFAAWTLGIARNQVATHYRRQRTQPTTRLDIPDSIFDIPTVADEGDPATVFAARERWAEVTHALNQLTEEQRNVLLYRFIHGYSAEDIAVMIGKQAGAVRALQFRALASLARILTLQTNPGDLGAKSIRGHKAPPTHGGAE